MACISRVALFLAALLCQPSTTFAFTSTAVKKDHRWTFAASIDDEVESATSEITGLLKRDRYVATNRFAVRRDQGPKFEKRWATRKSRLAELEGFRYFHLMRRVVLDPSSNNEKAVYDGGETKEEAQDNYVSFTIWEKKSSFSAWRNGEAFVEAHGGKSIGSFVSTMVNSALVLRGAPRPAFYDGLFTDAIVPESIPEAVDGWRQVDADGVTELPTECFVEVKKHFISEKSMASFEKEYKKDALSSGIVSTLMRRDGRAKGHGVVEPTSDEPTYIAVSVYPDMKAYQSANPSGLEESKDTVFYEGVLVLSSPKGA